MKSSIITKCIAVLAWISLFSMPVWAQAPGMPSAPSPVPIAGGLGILAVAGGAYALKKLRRKD